MDSVVCDGAEEGFFREDKVLEVVCKVRFAVQELGVLRWVGSQVGAMG
jgi:hypothetical protein